MYKKLKKLYRRLNPFIKVIKVVEGSSKLERHGNCFDIVNKYGININTHGGEFRQCVQSLQFKATLPKHYRGILHQRSSTQKYGIIPSGGYGEIEWDYTGHWMACFTALQNLVQIPPGTRTHQFHIEPVWDAPWYVKLTDIFSVFVFEEVKELTTSRGGLGSTGV